MKNILVPIGSHENALNTLQYAIDFAEQVNAKIYLVHIFSSSKISGGFIKIDPIYSVYFNLYILSVVFFVDKKIV